MGAPQHEGLACRAARVFGEHPTWIPIVGDEGSGVFPQDLAEDFYPRQSEPVHLNQFKMSKLKIKNARMLAASGNLLILNFAFLILLAWALEFGAFLELGVWSFANPPFPQKHRGS